MDGLSSGKIVLILIKGTSLKKYSLFSNFQNGMKIFFIKANIIRVLLLRYVIAIAL